jgi:hypothetical protein
MVIGDQHGPFLARQQPHPNDHFSRRVGQDRAAVAACVETLRCRASRLSGVPRRVGNTGVGGQAGAFGKPGVKHRDGASGEWGDPLFAALTQTADVPAGAQV